MYNRIELQLAPSHRVGLISAAPWLALAALSASLAISLHPLCGVALPLLLWQGLSRYRLRGLLQGDRAIICLTVRNNQLQLQLGDGETVEADCHAESRVYRTLAFLKVIDPARMLSPVPVILLASANCQTDQLRPLRVWLRLKAPAIP
ncbi:MAG: hypothetical protein LAT63_01370 [Marinobacter sp.]|nr:hypothetical protein [Marinobacter sp.]